MLCAPALKVEIERVATPLPFRVELPNDVLPSRNCTLPVGVPLVADLTVAVRVTAWLRFELSDEEVAVVLVPALPTVSVVTADVLGRKVASPE